MGGSIGDFKRPAHQCRKGFRIAAGLHKRNIAARIHVEFAQRLNGEVMGIAADAAHADSLALQVFRF